jgi:hypothetical protein
MVIFPMVVDQIVEHPLKQSLLCSCGPTFLSSLSIDETTNGDPKVWEQMEVNLEVVVEMVS